MEKFEEAFFQDEWREDFFIESKMKRAWAAQIEVLMEIDRICKKNHIQYFADSGTLLGAVRHKGFIPWDDDIDIAMKREEYQKFLSIIEKEMPESWKFCNIYVSESWELPFSRVINGKVINFNPEYLQKFHGCPYPVGVDIFPLDYVPKDNEDKEILICIQTLLYQVVQILRNEKIQDKLENLEEVLRQIEGVCKIEINREKSLVNQLLKLIDKLSLLYTSDESDQLTQYVWWATNNKDDRYQKEWYEESIWMPFENVMVPVPVQYDEVLKVMFGDYMTPVREYIHHDYPFYKKFDEMIEKYRKDISIEE